MKGTIRFFVAAALLMALLVACGGRDLPPDDATPEPTALTGMYAFKYGTMTFNGDGRSVTLDLSEDFAALSGLPSGKNEGSYVFLFHNAEWRRDKAEYFRLIIDGEDYQFRNDIGETKENTVAFLLDSGEKVQFNKEW